MLSPADPRNLTRPLRAGPEGRAAVHLLRTTELSPESIAGKVGHEHPHRLRLLLRERTGKTTAALRGV